MKSSQETEMFKFELGTGSDGNLVPIRMFRISFTQININELNKFINEKKIVLCTYNNSCIPQIVICHIVIIKKARSIDTVSL